MDWPGQIYASALGLSTQNVYVSNGTPAVFVYVAWFSPVVQNISGVKAPMPRPLRGGTGVPFAMFSRIPRTKAAWLMSLKKTVYAGLETGSKRLVRAGWRAASRVVRRSTILGLLCGPQFQAL